MAKLTVFSLLMALSLSSEAGFISLCQRTFGKLFRWGQSETDSLISRWEDPIKMMRRGIKELEGDIATNIEHLAKVKAMAMQTTSQRVAAEEAVEGYKRKAKFVLTKGQNGELDAAEAERLAAQALKRKSEAENEVQRLLKEEEVNETLVGQLQKDVDTLRDKIVDTEKRLKTSEARYKAAQTRKKINQELARTDSSGTLAMLDEMEGKVIEEEALAESYGEIAKAAARDDVINDVDDLGLLEAGFDSDRAVAELKEEMGPIRGKKDGTTGQWFRQSARELIRARKTMDGKFSLPFFSKRVAKFLKFFKPLYLFSNGHQTHMMLSVLTLVLDH